MRLKRDEHEALLNELLTPDLEHSRRTEILTQLRTHDVTFNSEYEELTTKASKLEKDNADLIVSNSKLFRQIGVTGTEQEPELEKKEFSETITLEQLEKGSATE